MQAQKTTNRAGGDYADFVPAAGCAGADALPPDVHNSWPSAETPAAEVQSQPADIQVRPSRSGHGFRRSIGQIH